MPPVEMTPLLSLWLPIIGSAIIVFIASSVIHMLTPWHNADYPKLPDEDKVADALRPLAIPPGDYIMPRAATMKEMSSPEFVEKRKRGPVVMMTVFPNGDLGMARELTLWFLYLVVVSIFAGYIAGRALPPARTTSRSSASPAPPHSSVTRWGSGRCGSGTSGLSERRSARRSTACSTGC